MSDDAKLVVCLLLTIASLVVTIAVVASGCS